MKSVLIVLAIAGIAVSSITVGDAETSGMDPFCAS